jgi:hypothetical protein
MSCQGLSGIGRGHNIPNGTCYLVLYVCRYDNYRCMLTGGSLVTDGRVTQILRKEKLRSNNSNDGNYLLLRGDSLEGDE